MKLTIIFLTVVALFGCTLEIGNEEDMSIPRSREWSQGGYLTPGRVGPQVGMQKGLDGLGNYTVQFEVGALPSPVSAGPGLTQFRTEAVVTWTVGGRSVSRRVSVVDGMSISGTAEAVDVRVEDTSRVISGSDLVVIPYEVSIQVAAGARATNSVPPFLEAREGPIEIAAAGAGSFDIPLNSGITSAFVSIGVIVGSATPLDGRVDISMQTNNQELKNVTVPFDGLTPPFWIPLAPGADEIAIYNRLTAITINASVTYGIDG